MKEQFYNFVATMIMCLKLAGPVTVIFLICATLSVVAAVSMLLGL